jgi:hypothetical protein
MALFSLGRTANADQALGVFVEEHKESAAYGIASAYAWRCDVDQAFNWLDTAYEKREASLPDIVSEPLLASLNSDPGWPAFLDKMGLPH